MRIECAFNPDSLQYALKRIRCEKAFIVEAEAHGTLQCSYVLTIDFVVFQPRRGVEYLVVVNYPLINCLHGKTALLRRGKIAVDVECRRARGPWSLSPGHFVRPRARLNGHVPNLTGNCPLTGRYREHCTITHFKHHLRVLRLISNRISV